MKYTLTLLLLTAGLWGLKTQALDIVIKTGDKEEIKKEEPKPEAEEDKGPDLPKPTQLVINMINTTPDSDFVVSAWATVKDAPIGFVVAQGTSAKGTTTTLAQLNAPEGSVFEYKKSEVILIKSPANLPIKCTIQASKNEDVKDGAKDEPKGDSDAGGKDEANVETSVEAKAEVNDEPAMQAKKSIDFWLYVPENQQLPSCVIMFDSL